MKQSIRVEGSVVYGVLTPSLRLGEVVSVKDTKLWVQNAEAALTASQMRAVADLLEPAEPVGVVQVVTAEGVREVGVLKSATLTMFE